MNKIKLYNDDCFNVFPKISPKSIDMVLVDLPYGQTACNWDIEIDLNEMWKQLKLICKENCQYIFFTTTKFGYKIIHSNPNWFRYDLVWEKPSSVGYLSANKMPLRNHEMMYIFKSPKAGVYNPQKTEGKPYKVKGTEYKNNITDVYGQTERTAHENKTGQRHPKSVLNDIEITDEERKHEMVYVFNNSNNDDVELTRNKDMRKYAEKVKNYINKPYSQIKKDFGNGNTSRFLTRYTLSQFSLPTEETYNKLIELYNIDKMDGFIKFDNLDFENYTYNPQKKEGKPYKFKGHELKNKDVYGIKEIPTSDNKTGQRHPKSVLTDIQITDEEAPKTTIIKENYDKEKLHRTQKPVKLCEWLIKSYSNENDLVLDFCMGSGSSILACKNTNRNYIGIEMNKDIFEIAKKRITN